MTNSFFLTSFTLIPKSERSLQLQGGLIVLSKDELNCLKTQLWAHAAHTHFVVYVTGGDWSEYFVTHQNRIMNILEYVLLR